MKNQLLILAALLLTALSARAQHEYIMTVDRFYPNDGDCYDGILFQFHSQNHKPEGDYNGCSVIELEKKELIQFIDLGYNQNFHAILP